MIGKDNKRRIISTFSTQDYATIVVAKLFRKIKEFLVVYNYNQKRRWIK